MYEENKKNRNDIVERVVVCDARCGLHEKKPDESRRPRAARYAYAKRRKRISRVAVGKSVSRGADGG